MKVQELIDKLQEIKDKESEVKIVQFVQIEEECKTIYASIDSLEEGPLYLGYKCYIICSE